MYIPTWVTYPELSAKNTRSPGCRSLRCTGVPTLDCELASRGIAKPKLVWKIQYMSPEQSKPLGVTPPYT